MVIRFRQPIELWIVDYCRAIMSNNKSHTDSNNITGQKRKSRFDTDITDPVLPEQKRLNLEVSQASARANELKKEIEEKMKLVQSFIMNNKGGEKKAAYRPLLLDAQGREIDEHGNLVKREIMPVKTLAANMAAVTANKKKENPYLAHRNSSASNVPLVASLAPSNSSSAATVVSTDEGKDLNQPPVPGTDFIVDERIPIRKRELKAKKALHFDETSKYVREAQKQAEKEERKMIAGYASGRKQLEKGTLPSLSVEAIPSNEPEPGKSTVVSAVDLSDDAVVAQLVPPAHDPIVPPMEWWDEAFLPKQRRDQRKLSKAAAELDEYEAVQLTNVKTYKFIQHPIPIKPLGMTNEKSIPVIPMYLTKKEKKKLRKAQRAEREREKRDQMMLGLLPTPEPKFKLSNFMKLLGDQAIADPSKIEMKVIEQMQKRVLNHEMRNQANKLTPQQRRAKKLRKLQEDTSRGVTVAVFRITDFSCLKYRFQVDITAQQYFLSGLGKSCVMCIFCVLILFWEYNSYVMSGREVKSSSG